MLIIHTISLDMMHPDTPPRIQVKQGDIYSRGLRILLYCDAEPWSIPAGATPLVRWFACDPDTGESARGIYDTLPDNSHAMQWTGNQLDLVLTPQMLAMPGLVQADVVLVSDETTLATFNFEFYVNPSPADGTEREAESYYRVITLDQINKTFAALQDFQSAANQRISELEQYLGFI